MLLSILFSLNAFAGKLEDGWRGIPYGDATKLETAPTANCKANTQFAVRWECQEQVGGQTVTVAYMVEYGIYKGVHITCKGFLACDTLFRTVSAAWADSAFVADRAAYGALPNGFFGLGDVAAHRTHVCASWKFNPYTDEGLIDVMNMDLIREVENRKAAEAAKNAQDL